MKENIKFLMQRLEFPSDAQKELTNTIDKLLNLDSFNNILFCFNSGNYDYLQLLSSAKDIALSHKLCEYTVYMALMLCFAVKLYDDYKKQGIDEKIYYDTISDLKYKLDECMLVHKKIGTFVPSWYKGFFAMKIFALGRLQFEINYTWFDCEVNGKKIPQGTKVLSVHIPRSGIRLDHDLVLNSYKQAKEFFKAEFKDDIIFICNSWLLYPWNRTILKDGSNLAKFYDDFTIVSTGEYKDYSETWRLFDCIYDGNTNNLPADSSLRRAYIDRINNNMPLGYATGVIVFD